MTTVPQHAERILEACQLANPNRFETEVENAWRSCRTQVPASGLEWEQQELLETIVENLRGLSLAQCAGHAARLNAEFALLKHLRGQRFIGAARARVQSQPALLTGSKLTLGQSDAK